MPSGWGGNLQRELQHLVDAQGGPPGAIVVLDGPGFHRVYQAGAGDLSTGVPPRESDYMRIASAAKAYSGAVALTLVDRGMLTLDDTLSERLPSLPADWGRVTLRELLNHTSGLPDYSGATAFRDELMADPHHHFDSRTLLDYVADQPLNFTPGTEYRYSNSDNIAIALMAEAATGCTYEELLQNLVYQPLGLTHTILPQGYRLRQPYLHGYAYLGAPTHQYDDVSTAIGASGAWASGGIVATPDDLNTFIKAYGGGRLISAATRREQLRFVPGASEPAGPGVNSVGLAIFRYQTRCGVVYGHTGNTLGYTQLAVSTPDGRRALTFSVNEQINQTRAPALLAQMRAVEEDFVCALVGDRS